MENGSIIFNDTINKAINNKSFTDHFDQDQLSILKKLNILKMKNYGIYQNINLEMSSYMCQMIMEALKKIEGT